MQNHWSKGVGALHNEIMDAYAILLFTISRFVSVILLSQTFIMQSSLS